MKTYSTKEASEKVGVTIRTIQKKCSKDNIRKVDNKYLITDELIAQWIKSNALQTPNERTGERTPFVGNQLDMITEIAKDEDVLKNIQNIDLDKIEDYDFKFNNIEGNLVFIPKDKIYEEFTPEEYDKMNEVVRDNPVIADQVKSYRNDIAYLKKSLDKKEEQMDLLLHSINHSLKAIQQGQFLTAKDKGYDKSE